MKELTIEQKAQRYDEAIKVAENIHRFSSDLSEIKRIEEMFPELKESDDEGIRKKLISYFSAVKGFSTLEYNYGITNEEVVDWLKKQGEQKPADKIELKFKVGDWVVSPNSVYWHIDKISNNRYEVTSNTGESSNWPLDTNIYHRFTIQDAKDGDVLAEDSCIFIIKKLNSDHSAKIYCCLYDDGDFEIISNLVFDDTSTHPATKEQRDTLERTITNDGYRWDKENLKLEKI